MQRVRNKIELLLRDGIVKRLVHGSTIALFISAAGQGLTFGLQILIARYLGASEYGVYSYALAWLSIGLILGKRGYDTALVRYIAAYNAKGLSSRAGEVVRSALRRCSMTGLVVGVPIAAAAWIVASQESPSLFGTLVMTAVLIPLGVTGEVLAAAVRGYGKPAQSLAGDTLVRPVLSALVLSALYVAGVHLTAFHAATTYTLGTCVSAAMTYFFLKVLWPQPVRATSKKLESLWSRTAALLMTANAFLVLLYSVDILMLGALDGTESAGFYNVASKLAILVLFVMNAAQIVAGPMVAAAYSQGRSDQVRRIIRVFNLLSVCAALVIAGLIGLLSPWLLAAFGPQFAASREPLLVLLGMQAFNVVTGPVGLLLGMTGRQKELAVLLGAAVLLNVALKFFLIPRYGAIGAAWSSFIAHGAWNLVGAIEIKRRLGVDCSIADWLRRPAMAGA